jgi:hypothetical protein
MLRRLTVALVAVAGLGYAGYRFAVLPWWRSWGVVPEEATANLPGDEVIPDAATNETRGITIDASPADVWPWLIQMGYGRGGWYSYDMVDMARPSADGILPEYQVLKAGDIVPTHPGGGFLVKLVEPERALVLYADTKLMEEQADAARSSTAAEASTNVRAAGAFMANAQPTDFAASWTFMLQPRPEGGTRLIERVRTKFGDTDKPWTRYTLPVMGFGVFAMVRRQLLGIKQRVERQQVPLPEEAAV